MSPFFTRSWPLNPVGVVGLSSAQTNFCFSPQEVSLTRWLDPSTSETIPLFNINKSTSRKLSNCSINTVSVSSLQDCGRRLRWRRRWQLGQNAAEIQLWKIIVFFFPETNHIVEHHTTPRLNKKGLKSNLICLFSALKWTAEDMLGGEFYIWRHVWGHVQ